MRYLVLLLCVFLLLGASECGASDSTPAAGDDATATAPATSG
jgi:hypothetical protein